VIDGDTITVLVDRRPRKVRLAEIDIPERGQRWAKQTTHAQCTARGYHGAEVARLTRSPT
jgi:endonuclease YncB( thermonuclease family)